MRMFAVVAILFVSAAAPVTAQMGRHKTFSFGSEKKNANYTQVVSSTVYDKSKGFGFEPGAEMNCGVNGCSSAKPFYFSTAVREGNYYVTVKFGDEKNATSTVVKAELRRLMIERVDTKPGEFVSRNFAVNVRTPVISTGGEVKLKDRERTSEQWAWDEKLTLEFNGTRPSIASIKIEPVSSWTVFLLGDSTVCDQPGEPYASWGQMITRFFGKKVAVANHAESGESLKSSLGARRLDKVLSQMKLGDYLLIQYGHNDEKEKGEGIGAFTSYKTSLKQFVDAAKKKGGIPILITPMHRRTFNANGKITNSHGDYPEAVRQVAQEGNVALIDLHAMSKDLYEALGSEGSGVLFKEGDGTHHNAYGAYQLAKSIVQSISDQRLPLAKFLLKDLPKYDPKHPDALATFSIPASPAVTNLKPLGS
ncbi:MAG TPA: rhamnogalacturonan acetylesterase [Pyrinomonadaceae bacterium]|nr:rhamnogalacturonan acetylesterase [Pyrinomonadaceae bacterium]